MAGFRDTGWYINEWLSELEMRQVDLARAAGWSKQKVSTLCSGTRGYNRKTIEEAAAVMGLHPAELLMEPKRALAIRQQMSRHPLT